MLACIIASAIFWFNPIVSNVDILPDLICYMLIMKAFSKASYVYDYAEDVLSALKPMCIISVAKLISLGLISSQDPSMSLLLSFSFGLAEIIFGIPFINKLFRAISQLSLNDGNDVALSRLDKIKNFTVVAYVTRLILACLPDLTALFIDSEASSSSIYMFVRFRPMLFFVSVIISLVVNSLWVVKFISFIKNAISKSVIEKCEMDFSSQMGDRSSLFTAKDNIKALLTIGIFSTFWLDLKWEHTQIDVLFDSLFPLAVVIAFTFLYLKGCYKIGKTFYLLIGGIVLQIVLTVIETIMNRRYFEKYNYSSIFRIPEAEEMYLKLTLMAILSAMVAIFICILVLKLIVDNAKNSLANCGKLFAGADMGYYLKEFNSKIRKNVIISIVFSVLSAGVYAVTVAFRPYAEWLILLNTIFEFAFVISFANVLFYLYDEVYKRIKIFS